MIDLHEYYLELCEKHQEASLYKNYGEIPSDLKCESFLTAWVVSTGNLEAIPLEERTELMLRTAVRHDRYAFPIIRPDDVSDYGALILDAIDNDPSNASYIWKEHITEDLIIKMAAKNVNALKYIDLSDWHSHLLTDSLVSSIIRMNVSKAVCFIKEIGNISMSRVNDEDIRAAIQVQVSDLHQLKSIGKVRVLNEMLTSGYWPEGLNAAIKMEKGQVLDIESPPASPHEALSRGSCIRTQGVRFLHLQSLRRFPIEEVVSTTEAIPGVVDCLLEVYTEKELRPHIRLSKALRGRFLENALGL
jgi:hypothetical protein